MKEVIKNFLIEVSGLKNVIEVYQIKQEDKVVILINHNKITKNTKVKLLSAIDDIANNFNFKINNSETEFYKDSIRLVIELKEGE